MIFIYNLILFIAILLFSPLIIIILLNHKNLKKGLWERFTIYNKNFKEFVSKNRNCIIWIHSSSVGEVNVSNILAKRLKEEFPIFKILITTMTVAGYENAKKIETYDYVLMLPFDFAIIIMRFLKIVSPKIILITETEFWPNIFYYSKKFSIPLIVYNCRISDSSFEKYLKFKFFFSKILNCANYYLSQNSITIERLKNLGITPQKIVYSGNLKYDLDQPSLSEDDILSEFNLKEFKDRFIIVGGSTHHPEEEILFRIIKRLDDSLLILAPRHIERIEDITQKLKEEKIKFNFITDKTFHTEIKVILINVIGILKKIYAIADVCFIGGSISLRGGHNPIEAVLFKKPVITGKNIFNFSDVYYELKRENGVIIVENEEDLYRAILKLKSDEKLRREIGENGFKVIERNKGAVEKVINVIRNYIT